MRIGELAARAEVNIQTLRFYEREGLLRRPMRTPSGYRSFEESDLERVRFIRICQGLGFTLREIQQLVQLHKSASASRGARTMQPAAVREIIELANERLAVINEKISALSTMRADLSQLVESLTVYPESPGTCPASR
ncbi:MerR family transcriptional regulator [Acidicapsa acidisoli]|uniref:MerR family transcriptional regulator n=1 Tax=Acidicapsa acidisoli TaxID=1615681 RepID=UPI0021E0C44A|nr:MerR family transcriptional regulator [Acidicapsa acidisoli]